ncbi:MAG: YgiT-type zinc finger protein [Chloroflexi bacterium]|nr:YgiT-type zinc finger protein [Chloroflexota bacterium]
MAKIPDFKTLDEAVEFWETHDSADYWEDLEEATFEVNLHRNLLHPKLSTLAYRPERCPRCQQALDDIMTEYVTLANGRLLVIRDVPVLRCQTNGHEYILEETLDKVEQLLELEKIEKLQPTEILSVPVFSLATSA